LRAGGRDDFPKGLGIMKATDTITVVEGYDAMRIFLETSWRRHGEFASEIELLIGGLKWADGAPVDPTLWEDWLAAVQTACIGRMPKIVEN
jgi:hypothetical protein